MEWGPNHTAIADLNGLIVRFPDCIPVLGFHGGDLVGNLPVFGLKERDLKEIRLPPQGLGDISIHPPGGFLKALKSQFGQGGNEYLRARTGWIDL
jgi:hypothetical protein